MQNMREREESRKSQWHMCPRCQSSQEKCCFCSQWRYELGVASKGAAPLSLSTGGPTLDAAAVHQPLRHSQPWEATQWEAQRLSRLYRRMDNMDSPAPAITNPGLPFLEPLRAPRGGVSLR